MYLTCFDVSTKLLRRRQGSRVGHGRNMGATWAQIVNLSVQKTAVSARVDYYYYYYYYHLPLPPSATPGTFDLHHLHPPSSRKTMKLAGSPKLYLTLYF